MHVYIPLRPDEYGRMYGGGYKCGACGLEGLENGEPHTSAAGRLCEPPPPADIPDDHPQAKFIGKPVTARADSGNGQLLRDDQAVTPPGADDKPHGIDQPNAETAPFSVQRDDARVLGGPSEDPRDQHPDGGIYDALDPNHPSAIDAGPHPAYEPAGGAAVLPDDALAPDPVANAPVAPPFQTDHGLGTGGAEPQPHQPV